MCGHDEYPTPDKASEEKDERPVAWSMEKIVRTAVQIMDACEGNPDPKHQDSLMFAKSVLSHFKAKEDLIRALAQCVRCTEVHHFEVECPSCGWKEMTPNLPAITPVSPRGTIH